jgi:pSer/pThr/pTyr-binding forkhead associated (FHA) protein
VVVVRWSDQTRYLPHGTYLIGRRADCAISIDAPSVSRVHAKLEVARERTSIEDLRSKNGTFAGGRRIESETELLPRTDVRIGDVELQIVRLDIATDSTVTTAR